MNDISKSVVKIVHAFNDYKGGIKVAYTFDAGPNAVCYMEEESMDEVRRVGGERAAHFVQRATSKR